MSYTSSTSASVQTGTSIADDSSSSTTTIQATVETSSPDESDGLAATVGGEAIALGEDTLAAGSVSGEMIDDGTVTSVDLSATMVAVGEAPEGETAFASADTFAEVSDGADVVFAYNQETQTTEQSATGNVATATSTTDLVAYDVQLSDLGEDGPAAQDGPVTSDPAEESSSLPQDIENVDIEGNIAALEIEAIAVGEDTFVAGDAFVLAIEDELSTSAAFVELAIE